ncbi:hypothetical protein [Chryseobacterium gregarium]|uniref:hypothetical protein n=1 Tax=Chryseobacterium gregarium TaxID=456299 RepID=UPI000489B8CA|nr:hypothetical protein [Chryseobacterium gregarium]
MNQLYYGSRFVNTEYSLSDYNKDYDEIWKIASRKGISKGKAQKILATTEAAYNKGALNKDILVSMVNIYIMRLEKKLKRKYVYSRIIKSLKRSMKAERGKRKPHQFV